MVGPSVISSFPGNYFPSLAWHSFCSWQIPADNLIKPIETAKEGKGEEM